MKKIPTDTAVFIAAVLLLLAALAWPPREGLLFFDAIQKFFQKLASCPPIAYNI